MLAAALRQQLEAEFERVLEDAGLKDQQQLFQSLCLAIEKPGLLLSFYNASSDVGVEALEALYPRGTSCPPRPDTPMSVNCLLTGTDSEPHLASQLKKELASADRCDILCSFIKWSGLRLLWDELKRFVETPGHQLRLITTSYMGATDAKAIEELSKLPNTQVRISYDTQRTRLHAKAYCFHRQTGYSAAYVGSANVSQAALTEGLEWVVKISQADSASVWQKVRSTFESYWQDPEFELYTMADAGRLRTALHQERSKQAEQIDFQAFDLRPFGFQQVILDRLLMERVGLDRHQHLVVAATGTGKTMIAGFDYKAYRQEFIQREGRQPRLLFIAHTAEILRQSLYSFRGILRDGSFGDLLVGDHVPHQYDHLFCSIQSFHSKRLADEFSPDHFDYVIVDEFHHAAAPTYAALLKFLRPKELLGLTATPERTDVKDILHHFGGRITEEIRLPDAITRELLCPFQYFGIADLIDLSGVSWRRGAYDTTELERLMVDNQARTNLIIQELESKLTDVSLARGIGFCVSVMHANYMARAFQQAGIPAGAITGGTPHSERLQLIQQLQRRELNFLFTVDVLGEGIDIPEVDTVLLLRPTESLLIFLQQIGRGLRLSPGKECLTILDFVAQQQRGFRFEERFQALLRGRHRSVEEEIKRGFPHLPPGCAIVLDRVSQERILENIQGAIAGAQRLIQLAKQQAAELGRPPSLSEYFRASRITPQYFYKYLTFEQLKQEAGWLSAPAEPDTDRLKRGLRRAAHLADTVLVDLLEAAVESEPLDDQARLRARMLYFSMMGRGTADLTEEAGLRQLRQFPRHLQELKHLLQFNIEQRGFLPQAPDLPYPCPLMVHSEYTRDEILAAFDDLQLGSNLSMREGMRYLPHLNTYLFFVTLVKSESDYSPSTMYRDYAVNERLFHWETQSTTSADSPTGQRFSGRRDHGCIFLLFVREQKKVDGLAQPYYFLGPVNYVSHEGSRPMSILWEMRYPLPAVLLQASARLKIT